MLVLCIAGPRGNRKRKSNPHTLALPGNATLMEPNGWVNFLPLVFSPVKVAFHLHSLTQFVDMKAASALQRLIGTSRCFATSRGLDAGPTLEIFDS
jgi:hypothetical protein